MRVKYGSKVIEVDASGRGRLVEGSPTSSMPAARSPVKEFDSKLEAARARYLTGLTLAGEVRRVVYHPFKVEIGPGRWYTPDFLVEWSNGALVVEEVKGHVQMKNARDSISRLHAAADKLPMFVWQLVLAPTGCGDWDVRVIKRGE